VGSPGAPIPDHRPDKLPGHSLSSFSAFVILAMTSSLGLREPLIEAYKLTVAQRALVGPSPSHGQTLGRAEPRTVLAEEFVRLKPCHPGTPPARRSSPSACAGQWIKPPKPTIHKIVLVKSKKNAFRRIEKVMSTCPHTNIRCLNEFELIRKYRCEACGAVMMCACDEAVGRKFRAHQLDCGVELETQRRVSVTAGFQLNLCEECRKLPLTPHPVAAIYGRTSKIRRYYWRELAFETLKRFDAWSQTRGTSNRTRAEDAEAKKKIKGDVLQDLKSLHATTPKYVFSEESQAEVVKKYGIDVIALNGRYASNSESRSAIILDDNGPCSVEEYACGHFRSLGYDTLFVESGPFHVLFGVFMWLVIQDPTDSHNRIVSFGDRKAFDAGTSGELISTHLPDDFGTRGYARRRTKAIEKHLSPAMCEPGELQWLFDYWLGPSEGLRQYLWAHREEQIQVARQLIDIIPPAAIVKIIRYLVEDFWGRYLGWPDLLVHGGNEFFFAEIKSSGDKLGEKQKHWIRDNHERLHFPFKLIKVHKVATA
jgi:hypothetical protein